MLPFCHKWDLGQSRGFFYIKLNALGNDIAMAFPGIHVLSGCHSTSVISVIGKVKIFKAVYKDERFVNAPAILGESLDLSDAVDVLEELFYCLYGLKEEISINEARYRLFTKRKKVWN